MSSRGRRGGGKRKWWRGAEENREKRESGGGGRRGRTRESKRCEWAWEGVGGREGKRGFGGYAGLGKARTNEPQSERANERVDWFGVGGVGSEVEGGRWRLLPPQLHLGAGGPARWPR